MILGDLDIIVNSSQEFILTCVGEKKLSWTYPKTVSRNRVTIQNNKSHSILTVSNSSYLDVGEYNCTEKEDKTPASVYVFVKDETHLLAVKKPATGYVLLVGKEYNEVVIPCRPSWPEVQVNLHRLDGFIEDSKQLNYTPKVGYTLHDLAIHDSGYYSCEAVYNDEIESVDLHLNVLIHTDYVPRPNINSSLAQHVVTNSNLTLICNINVQLGTQFSMNWILPKTISDTNSTRIIRGDAVHIEESPSGIQKWRCVLTVVNVTQQDSGTYNCSVMDHNKNVNSNTYDVRIFQPDDTYINITTDGQVQEMLAYSGYARWVITVTAHPRPVLTWLGPDGKELKRDNDKYEIQTDERTTIIKIHDVNLEDTGNYTLVAENEGGKQQLVLTLVVLDSPFVTIVRETKYYQLNKQHVFTCQVVGYPTPIIGWSFRNCTGLTQDCSHLPFIPVQISQGLISELELDSRHIQSHLTWPMNESVELFCTALNRIGSGNDTLLAYVTDVPAGFQTIVPDVVVEGDDVTVTCAATNYDYTANLKWVKKTQDGDLAIDNVPRVVEVVYSTKYSSWSNLIFKNVNVNHGGEYVCQGLTRNKTIVESVANLNVLELSVPVIYDTNLNGSEIKISSWRPLEWRCAVQGVPTPTITWYKDGVLLTNSPNATNIEMLDDNQTLVLKSLTMLDEGHYMCRAVNKAGFKEASVYLRLPGANKNHMVLIIVVSAVAAGLVLLVAFLLIKLWQHKKLRDELKEAGLLYFEKGAVECINPNLPLEEQAELLPYHAKWEFPRSRLKLGKQLGSGAFGVVMKAQAARIIDGEDSTTVAVKMVQRQADSRHIRALASELKILIHLGSHLNVVNLLGACTQNVTKRELLVIVEFCQHGNLHDYLLKQRHQFINQINDRDEIDVTQVLVVADRSRINYATLAFSNSVNSDPSSAVCSVNTDTTLLSQGHDRAYSTNEYTVKNDLYQRSEDRAVVDIDAVTTSTLLCWSFQVARGMEYLASRKVLHGDLAARNILLADNNIVKICDFGLAKNVYKDEFYKKEGNGPLPLKWMAIESIRDRIFTTQSDVWSFGIVMWEFFSLARVPYPDMQEFDHLLHKLTYGYRLEKPKYSTDRLYNVMLECWEEEPMQRPTFTQLAERLGSLMQNNDMQHYIDLNEPYQYMNKLNQNGEDYLAMVSPPTYEVTTNQPHYVNCPEQPKTPLTPGYLDMRVTWSSAKSSSEEDCVELSPMLNGNVSPGTEAPFINDDYLVPRQVPVGADSFMNPSYSMSNKIGNNYGKLRQNQDNSARLV